MQEDPHNILIQLTPIIRRWYRHILISTVIATVSAIIITSPLFIKPEYSSVVILYPPAKYTNKYQNNTDPEFGNELQADEHVQILLSNELRDSIVNRYSLVSHYEIDTLNPRWKERLDKEYENNMSVSRTAYNSIEIKITDTDPVLAAKIVNDIAVTGDLIKESIIKSSSSAIVENARQEYISKKRETDSLFILLNMVRDKNFRKDIDNKKNIYDDKEKLVASLLLKIEKIRSEYGAYHLDVKIDQINRELITAQSEKLNFEGMLTVFQKKYKTDDTLIINTQARYAGASLKASKLESELNKLSSVNREYVNLQDRYNSEISQVAGLSSDLSRMNFDFEKVIPNINYETVKQIYQHEIERLILLKTNYENALNNFREPYVHSYIISYPEVSYKKVYPKRLLITGITLILSFLTSLSIVLILEKIKALKNAGHHS